MTELKEIVCVVFIYLFFFISFPQKIKRNKNCSSWSHSWRLRVKSFHEYILKKEK